MNPKSTLTNLINIFQSFVGIVAKVLENISFVSFKSELKKITNSARSGCCDKKSKEITFEGLSNKLFSVVFKEAVRKSLMCVATHLENI